LDGCKIDRKTWQLFAIFGVNFSVTLCEILKKFNYLMKVLKFLTVCLLSGIVLDPTILSAQQPQTSNPESVQINNDPIVEIMDSLVMLNNVIRFNSINTIDESQGIRADVPYYSDEIYAQRISKIYSPIPLTYNEEVKKYIELYAYKRKSLTGRMLGLSNLYFPMYEEILDKEGLPLEFKYLSVVESALNPVAVSKMGATGLWQFMFNTGKMYNLKNNSYIDERRDPVKSTYAACQYFKDMYAIYGDWLLVIAAYNCGPGNVNKAIRRSGGKTSFWEIAKFLPAETRGYVPAFIAVTYVMNYASEHNIFAVQPAFNYFEVDTIAIDRSLSLRKISDVTGLPPDVIAYLNPVYKRGVIPDTEFPNVLRLPASAVPAFLAAESTIYDPLQTPVVFASASKGIIIDDDADAGSSGSFKIEKKKVKKIYTVKSGDNLSMVSGKLKCSVSELKKWNHLKSDMIRKGQQLSYFKTVQIKIPVEPPVEVATVSTVKNEINQDIADSSATSANNTERKNESQIKTEFVYHKVEKGDTLWNIAKRYEGVTVDQIIEMNRITNINSLVPGMRIKVKVNG